MSVPATGVLRNALCSELTLKVLIQAWVTHLTPLPALEDPGLFCYWKRQCLLCLLSLLLPLPLSSCLPFLPSFFNVGANNHPPFSLNDDFFLTWGRMVRNGDAVLWKGVRHEGCTCWVNWAYMWSFSSNKTCTSGHSGLSDSGGSPELRPHSAYGKLATPPPRVCV